MYTGDEPKKARKVTLSDVSGDSVQVSWTTPKEHIYSAFEVMYSTSEDVYKRQLQQVSLN